MTDDRSYRQQTGRPRSGGRLLFVSLIAFLIGLAVMAWALTRWDAAARYLGIAPPVAAPAPKAPEQPIVIPPPASPITANPADPQFPQRLLRLEQRFAQVENLSQAAVTNADRAEALLVAFAARRAIDRGVPLGYIEGLLRRRFGESQPAAVGTIIAASRDPVTLDELREGLAALAPTLAGASASQSWLSAIRSELGNLVTVRKAGAPSTVPQERVNRAIRRLDAGQVDVALAEVLRLPAHDRARNWIEDARQYVAARRALDTIETAALLESHTVQNPSPPADPPSE